jgi:hypothetical protein
MNATMEQAPDLHQLLGTVAGFPPDVARGDHAEQLKAYQLRIQSLFKEMDKTYPRISQLTLAATLAQDSIDLIQPKTPIQKLTCPPKSSDDDPLHHFLCAEQGYITAFNTQLKDGKDCRAAIALIGN